MSNTFLGSKRNVVCSDFTFVGINYCSADYLKGVELAADKLRELSGRYANADGSTFPLKVYSPEEGFILYNTIIRDLGNITATNQNELRMGLNKISFSNVPIFVGGDHSVTYELIRRVTRDRVNRKVVVIQFDAHSDYIDEYDEYPHGSVMNETHKLDTVEKIIHFGIRGNLNCEPAITMSKNDGNIIVPYYKITNYMNEVLEAIKGKDVYITFDTDFMCPTYAPATNCIEPGGPNYEETLHYMKTIIQSSGSIVGIDFVEYNPQCEGAVLTGTTIVNLIMEAMSYHMIKSNTYLAKEE